MTNMTYVKREGDEDKDTGRGRVNKVGKGSDHFAQPNRQIRERRNPALFTLPHLQPSRDKKSPSLSLQVHDKCLALHPVPEHRRHIEEVIATSKKGSVHRLPGLAPIGA